MRPAIETVMRSFARHAPANTMLAIKEHPLDSGLKDWRTVVTEIAGSLGIGERIAFLEQGDLLKLVNGSRGMVTVNSTSGTLSLAAGRAVKVLGDAVYDIPGVTDQQPLDSFWLNPVAPDPTIYDAFHRVLANRCLLHGAFLSNAGIDLLVSAAMTRLTEAGPVDLAVPVARLRP
jgi:capsular polysaccharide export protein